jgi:hypothetical protein
MPKAVITKTARQVLEEVKAKYPMPGSQSNWKALKEDPGFFDILLEAIASGHSIIDFARAVDLPEGRITSWLARLGDAQQDQYASARQARATIMAERILVEMENVRLGLVPPSQGKFICDNLMWLAARLDPQQWGNKIHVQAEVKTTTEMHLEAVRELAERVRGGDTRPVIEGEVEPKLINRDLEHTEQPEQPQSTVDAMAGLLD